MPLIEDALAALADADAALQEDEVGCHVLVRSNGRTPRDRWQRVSMDGTLAERFLDAARLSMSRFRQLTADEDGLVPFNFDAMATGTIGVMALEDAPQLVDWLDEVPGEDFPNVFTADHDFVEKTRFYATLLSMPDGRVLRAFRGKRGMQIVLQRTSKIAAMFKQDSDELEPVARTVITFDQEIDFFEWDGFVFIVNLPIFESITNMREVTIAKANEALDGIAARFYVPNLEDLKAHLGGRIKLSKKLAAAVKHGVLDDVDGARLIQRITDRRMSVRCVLVDDRYQFELDLRNRFEVEQFVNLLTDVYLKSPVTNREWKALAKTPA